ncbi:MAG: VTT domain-containing protein [Haloferacaceae archaeon]
MDRRRAVGAGTLLAAVALLAAASSPQVVLRRLTWLAADPVRYGLLCLGLAAVRPLFAWPVTLLAVAVGFGYGPLAAPFALALMVLTSIPPYLFARRLGAGGRVADVGERITEATGSTRVIVISRFLPTPSDAVSAAAGVAGIAPRPFLVGSAVGEVPWAVAGTLAGASLPRLVRGSVEFDPRFVAAAALMALLLLAGPAYRAYRGRRSD